MIGYYGRCCFKCDQHSHALCRQMYHLHHGIITNTDGCTTAFVNRLEGKPISDRRRYAQARGSSMCLCGRPGLGLLHLMQEGMYQGRTPLCLYNNHLWETRVYEPA